jgi:signal transduction histidine kinase/CheY-like chemotaxis protein
MARLVALALGEALAVTVEILLRSHARSGWGIGSPAGRLVGGLVVGTFGAGLAVLAYRAEARRQGFSQWVTGTDDLLRSADLVSEAERGVDVGDELFGLLLQRIRRACDASGVTALVASEDRRELRVQAVAAEGVEIPKVRSVQLGTGDLARLMALNGPAGFDASEFTDLLARPRWGQAFGVAGCALVANGEVLGAVLMGQVRPRRFSAEQLEMLQLGADRLAAILDRCRVGQAERRSRLGAEHARLHVALQSDASLELAAALDDYAPGLSQLSKVLVPRFADLCVIDVRKRDGGIDTFAREATGTVSSMGWNDEQTLEVLNIGGARLWYEGSVADDEVGQRLAWIGSAENLTSILVAPIQVGGLGLGALTLGTRAGRRGFRPSDLEVAQDLARRTAIALERVWLYQAERQARVEAAIFADRLQRLTDAELEISRAIAGRELVAVAVANARGVLGGTASRIRRRTTDGAFTSEDAPEHVAASQSEALEAILNQVCATNRPHQTDGELGAPLVDATGANQGAIAVIRVDGKFTAADGHLLLTLTQTVSTGLLKAELLGEVRRNEARLRELLEASPLATVELSPAGDVRRSNGAAATLLRWPVDIEGAPRPAAEALSPWLSPLLQRAASGEPSVGVSVEWHRRQLEVSCVPLWEQTDQVRGVLLVAADMTERHRLWAELRDAQRTEAVAELAGGVAHDFNNLLTVILGYTGMLLPQFEGDDHRRKSLESIDRAGRRAADLTNQLLTIGRRQVPKADVVDPAALVASLRDVLARLCGVDIKVNLSTEAGIGNVVIDPAHLDQVILNLAINARDAMPGGGSLGLLARNDPADDRWIVIEVSDTGSGMDEATRARCFEPFFTTKPRQHGTGLGLASVKGIVEQAGGSVTVDSRLGMGTTFRIRLPRISEAASPSAPARPSTGGETGTEVILLVEDEDDVRQLAIDVLERQGYTVLAAENATDAAQLYGASDHPVDLLLTDVVLPGMRGPDFADELRASRPELPVLFLSGYVAESSRRLASGAPFLAKPFSPDALAGMVRRTLADSGVMPISDPDIQDCDQLIPAHGSNR